MTLDPETLLAPAHRDLDPRLETAEELARAVRRDPSAYSDAHSLAAAARLGRTELGTLFRDHFHESPEAFLIRARVGAAEELLGETNASPPEITRAVGFASPAAFDEDFRRSTFLRPGEYRAMTRARDFALRLPDDFRAEETLRFFERDPEGVAERREGMRAAKALLLEGKQAVLTIEFARGFALCRVESRAHPSPAAMRCAHVAAVALLGLRCDPGAFERRVRRLVGMGRLLRGRRGLRVPLTADPFESVVWSVVGQQVNLAFAVALRRRLVELCGSRAAWGLRTHPTPVQVAKLDYGDLLPLQFSRRKAEYVVDLARAIVSGELPLRELARGSAVHAERALLARRGLGPWSANYVMLRGFGFADCLPVGDSGLMLSLKEFFGLARRPSPAETRERMQPFRPWRSLACLHFWHRLGEPG